VLSSILGARTPFPYQLSRVAMSVRRAMLGAALASSSATIGGATVVLTRYILPESDPFSLPMARYGIGALVLLLIVYVTGSAQRILTRDWLAIVLLSLVFYTAFPWAFARALEDTTAARAGIVYTSMPLSALVFGTLIGKETMSWRKVIAVTIALGGISLTLSEDLGDVAPNAWRGDLFMVLAAFFCAVYVLYARPYVVRYGGLNLTAIQMMIGSVALVPIAIVMGTPFSGSLDFDSTGWAVLLILAIPGASLMVMIYIMAINMTNPTGVTMTVGFNPLSSIILGSLILSEPVTYRIVGGFLCIVGAVILSNMERQMEK
jgi:drug/metabolite transporter (DMT)-like permease